MVQPGRLRCAGSEYFRHEPEELTPWTRSSGCRLLPGQELEPAEMGAGQAAAADGCHQRVEPPQLRKSEQRDQFERVSFRRGGNQRHGHYRPHRSAQRQILLLRNGRGQRFSKLKRTAARSRPCLRVPGMFDSWGGLSSFSVHYTLSLNPRLRARRKSHPTLVKLEETLIKCSVSTANVDKVPPATRAISRGHSQPAQFFCGVSLVHASFASKPNVPVPFFLCFTNCINVISTGQD